MSKCMITRRNLEESRDEMVGTAVSEKFLHLCVGYPISFEWTTVWLLGTSILLCVHKHDFNGIKNDDLFDAKNSNQ